jgi:hypothetical protein
MKQLRVSLFSISLETFKNSSKSFSIYDLSNGFIDPDHFQAFFINTIVLDIGINCISLHLSSSSFTISLIINGFRL